MNENGSGSNTSGKTTLGMDFLPKKPGDNLSDVVLAEVARRLVGIITLDPVSDIWGEPSEPTDKSLIWWPRDPINSTRIGKPRTYDTVSGKWVELGGEIPKVYAPRKRRNGFVDLVAGVSTANVSFETIGTAEYHITLTPHLYQGGVYVAAPVSTNNFALWIAGRASDGFVIQAYAVPTGGCRVEWEIAEKAAEEAK